MGSSDMGGLRIPPGGILSKPVKRCVILIEDDPRVCRTLQSQIEALGYEMMYFQTISSSMDVVSEMAKVNFIGIEAFVVDCCMDDSEVPNTDCIVKELKKKGFTGPILAQSGDIVNTELLIEAGANDKCGKFDIFSKLKELLKIK
jgi:DNA-binding response OmpR family regulator